MRRAAAFVVSGILAGSLLLAGCGSGTQSGNDGSQTGGDTTTESTDTSEGKTEQVTGGWKVNKEASCTLSDNDRAMFENAIANMGDEESAVFEPYALLATQVVAGENYAFLCTSFDGWYVVVVYRDLDDNVNITSYRNIDLADIKVADADTPSEELVGGWSIVEQPDSELLPAEAQEAFEKAAANYGDKKLHAIATLGTQLVSGTNYRVLCAEDADTAKPNTGLYVAQVYADLEGNCEMSQVQAFDLIAYLGQ